MPSPLPRFPDVAPGLGVGLDVQWGRGLRADPVGGDRPSPGLSRFLQAQSSRFDHLFVSWQPRSRGRMRLEEYTQGWDALLRDAAGFKAVGLHHTALNLASARWTRGALLAFTNALVRRCGLRWVNEDLGFWFLNGRPLPYPLPPLLTDAGLEVCVRSARECQEALDVPLLVEFPGFSGEWSVCAGSWDAYDFFREVVQRSASPCTLDVGHLLSWRWLRGHRGEALLGGLERLPLEHCFEVHLSGVYVEGERFIDAHHGLLVPEQLELLSRLRPLCPNLALVTFEDPVFDEAGEMNAGNLKSLAALEACFAA